MQSSPQLLFAPPRYQYEDYTSWSDEWELIDGYLYSLTPLPNLYISYLITGLAE